MFRVAQGATLLVLSQLLANKIENIIPLCEMHKIILHEMRLNPHSEKLKNIKIPICLLFNFTLIKFN